MGGGDGRDRVAAAAAGPLPHPPQPQLNRLILPPHPPHPRLLLLACCSAAASAASMPVRRASSAVTMAATSAAAPLPVPISAASAPATDPVPAAVRASTLGSVPACEGGAGGGRHVQAGRHAGHPPSLPPHPPSPPTHGRPRRGHGREREQVHLERRGGGGQRDVRVRPVVGHAQQAHGLPVVNAARGGEGGAGVEAAACRTRRRSHSLPTSRRPALRWAARRVSPPILPLLSPPVEGQRCVGLPAVCSAGQRRQRHGANLLQEQLTLRTARATRGAGQVEDVVAHQAARVHREAPLAHPAGLGPRVRPSARRALARGRRGRRLRARRASERRRGGGPERRRLAHRQLARGRRLDERTHRGQPRLHGRRRPTTSSHGGFAAEGHAAHARRAARRSSRAGHVGRGDRQARVGGYPRNRHVAVGRLVNKHEPGRARRRRGAAGDVGGLCQRVATTE